ncbi:MAG: amidase family protein, partial [Promethearchaeota archaeon]
MKKKQITKEVLSKAEIIAGLKFNDEKREQMLDFLNQFLINYVEQRKNKLEYNIEPPFYFNPQLTGVSYLKESKQNKFSKLKGVDLPLNAEEVAFYSLIQLSWLIKEQKISSLDLTNIYLKRLTRYNPKLECVITITEDIALKQAEIADNEISKGKYRGLLHGIPYGVKDLLAFPNFPTTWGAEPYKNQIINEKATIIKKLEQAGAIMIAKLSL